MFGHEKLVVYKKSMEFVALRRELLACISRRVIACDHFERASESILLNIAHASSAWSPKERIVYLGHANGSALECAACLDIFVAKALLFTEWVENIIESSSCSSDLLAKLDKPSTGIVLNIAKGNGRFSKTDQIRFLRISHKATIQSASLVDLAVVDDVSDGKTQDGKNMLRQIAAMLISLSKKVSL